MTKPAEIVPTLYPCVYAGPKEAKRQLIPGRNGPVVFHRDPDGQQIAFVTELEARWIAKNCVGGEFTFPKGLRNPDDKEDLWSRLEKLAEQVGTLTARVAELAAPDSKPAKAAKEAKPAPETVAA